MSQIKTVYDHIRRNNIQTFFLVLLFPLIFIALTYLLVLLVSDYTTALQTTTTVAIPTMIICAIWMLISWAFGDSMILNAANAHEISADDPEYREIFRSVENVAIAAGLPMPRVYIIEDNALNAFATGRTPRDASVALTRGIIKKLDKTELSGVIAHEMAHIGNRDIRLDMLVITGVGVTVFIADIIMRTIMYRPHTSSDDKDNANMQAVLVMVWLAFVIFNAIITPLLRMAISRNREYAADATGAYITRNPDALASALRKISGQSSLSNQNNTKSMASIFIATPSPRALLGGLMSTHPPVEKRIARLESMNIK